jgi:metal-dependent HD superfamily phosphatase/phosphodiesterase
MSENEQVTLATVREDAEAQVFIRRADRNLEELGYTDHGTRHCGIVAAVAYDILARLGRPKRQAELAAVAGYLHDTGNLISREEHGIACGAQPAGHAGGRDRRSHGGHRQP